VLSLGEFDRANLYDIIDPFLCKKSSFSILRTCLILNFKQFLSIIDCESQNTDLILIRSFLWWNWSRKYWM